MMNGRPDLKKSLRYKQNHSGSYSQRKKYALVIAGAFFGGVLLSVGGYRFFLAPSNDRVPTVAGYAFPVRTYVAPREEKNTQQIYDLDQVEEAPVVEKILPCQDVTESIPAKTLLPRESTTESAEKLEHSKPEESSDQKQSLTLKSQDTPKLNATDVKGASQTERSILEEKKHNQLHKVAPNTPEKLHSALKRRVQIGSVFSDLDRAKSFLVRLRAKAEGYRFALQSRAINEKIMYRVITQDALTPEQIKELHGLVPLLSKK